MEARAITCTGPTALGPRWRWTAWAAPRCAPRPPELRRATRPPPVPARRVSRPSSAAPAQPA
eukprot:3147591-Alexandrium_andersonii.AAC.1